jgi:hypothetical protein
MGGDDHAAVSVTAERIRRMKRQKRRNPLPVVAESID